MDMQALMPLSPTRHPAKNSEERQKKTRNGLSKSESWLEGTLNSEYKKEFLEKEVQVERPRMNYDGPSSPVSKFEASTTYGGDYKVQATSRIGYIIPPSSQTLSGAPFQGNSSYNQQYGPKTAAPFTMAKGPVGQIHPEEQEFCSKTTYGGAYTLTGVPQPATKFLPTSNIKPEGMFQGQSMYKSAFTKMPGARSHPIFPAPSHGIIPSGVFEDATLYKSSFVPKEITGHVESVKPSDARPMSQGEKLAPTYDTEYNRQYLDKETGAPQATTLSKAKICSEVLPRGQLLGTSTYNGAYKHEMQPRLFPTKPPDAVKHELHAFQGSSSYTSAYSPKSVAYIKAQPVHQYVPSKEPLEEYTSHKAAYQEYKIAPRVRGGPTAGGIQKEDIPFEGLSSYKSEFTKMPGAKRETIHSSATPFMPVGDFIGSSTYLNDFVKKEIGKIVRPGPYDEIDC